MKRTKNTVKCEGVCQVPQRFWDRGVLFPDGDYLDGDFTNGEAGAKFVWKCACCGYLRPRKLKNSKTKAERDKKWMLENGLELLED